MAQQDTDVDMTDTQSQREPFSVVDAFKTKVSCSLTPDDIFHLDESPSQVFVCGPPGTGKTLVLKRQGVTWLNKGYDVYVVSVSHSSLAATFSIVDQLQKVAEMHEISPRPQVTMHRFKFFTNFKEFGRNFDEVDRAVQILTDAASGKRQLCILIDEADIEIISGGIFEDFCQKLKESSTRILLYMCVAATSHNIRADFLNEIKLTKPLRSTQVIIREVKKANEIRGKLVYDYTENCDLPEGLGLMNVMHGGSGDYPLRSIESGRKVADTLKSLQDIRPPSTPLHNRDIFILYPENVESSRMTELNNFIQGLREKNIPARLVERGDEIDDAMKEIALMRTDDVIVTHYKNVRGLERKVVVVPEYTSDFSIKDYELRWISRCTEQLIILKCI